MFVESKIKENIEEIEREPGAHEDHHDRDQQVCCLLGSLVPRLVVVDTRLSHGRQLYLLPGHGVPQLSPEGERRELPVDPDVGQQEDGGGQQELDTEDGDAVGEPPVLRAPVLHAVGPLTDAEGLDDVGPQLDDVQPGVGDDGGGAQGGTQPDQADAGQADDGAAAGPDGVEDHVVSVQGYQADREGRGEAEQQGEEHGQLAQRLHTRQGPRAG